MDLLAFERKLDQTIARKRMEIQEAIKKPITVRLFMLFISSELWQPFITPRQYSKLSANWKTFELQIEHNFYVLNQQKRKLRIYISNTYTPAKPEGEEAEKVASWELRVEGKLLEDVRNAFQCVCLLPCCMWEVTRWGIHDKPLQLQ